MKPAPFVLLVLASLSSFAACGGSTREGEPLRVAATDSVDISIAAGGAPSPCPAAAGTPIAFDYRIDFGASALHVDDTLACAAPGAAHATHDVSLRAVDRATLLSLANALVFEKTSSCALDGATTTLGVYSSGAKEQFGVDGQGGECTVGAIAIRGAEFDTLLDAVSGLAQ